MATPLREIYTKIGKLTGKIISDNELELHGPQESIKLFLQQVASTRNTFAREHYETYGETSLLDLTVKIITDEQVSLIGEWQLFEPFLTKFGIKIVSLIEDTSSLKHITPLEIKP